MTLEDFFELYFTDDTNFVRAYNRLHNAGLLTTGQIIEHRARNRQRDQAHKDFRNILKIGRTTSDAIVAALERLEAQAQAQAHPLYIDAAIAQVATMES